MNVYVSWAYMNEAQKAEERLATWSEELNTKKKADKDLRAKLTPELCLPELAEFRQVESDAPQYDKLNQNLLAVKLVTPSLGRTVSYQLSRRMPGAGKLPLSLAVRSHLLKTFEGEWDYNKAAPAGRVRFIGHPGTKDFLEALDHACVALGHPFPACFADAEVREYADVREVLDATAVNETDAVAKEKLVAMLTGWMGPAASAIRDNTTILAYGFLRGWEVEEDEPTE
jgi:hypothetical protein